jgi:uncharacterized protein YndB with AHSA1/START domain
MNGDERNGWELSVGRRIEAPPERVCRIMTERLVEWWCPRPWRTEIRAVEWCSGGAFDTRMRGPNPGEESDNRGIFLEVTPGRRFVFTDAFSVGSIRRRNAPSDTVVRW